MMLVFSLKISETLQLCHQHPGQSLAHTARSLPEPSLVTAWWGNALVNVLSEKESPARTMHRMLGRWTGQCAHSLLSHPELVPATLSTQRGGQ